MKKQIFFTSDWHLGHENSIVFDHRPFKDLADMHRNIIVNFNKQVPKDGLTYFLGDIVIGSTEQAKEIIDQLNGTKVIVMGNHDKGVQSLYNCGFDVVLHNAMIMIQKQHVTMSHCPLRGLFREDTSNMKGHSQGELWHGEKRSPDFSIENYGQFHLHGHIHSPNHGQR